MQHLRLMDAFNVTQEGGKEELQRFAPCSDFKSALEEGRGDEIQAQLGLLKSKWIQLLFTTCHFQDPQTNFVALEE